MVFRFRLKWKLSLGVLVLVLLGLYSHQSYAGDSGISATEEQLQRRLLAEILDDKGNNRVVKSTRTESPLEPAVAKKTQENHQAGTSQSTSQKTSEPSSEIGSSVASVPTWPVMILVVFMAGILVWLKKGGRLGNSHANSINKLAVVPLGGKRSLALVEVLGQKLVLGMSEKGLSLLTKIDSVDPVLHQQAQDLEFDGAEDPFEQELRDILSSEPGDVDGLPASVERVDLARKFRNIRNG